MPKTTAKLRTKVDIRRAVHAMLGRLRFSLSAAIARIRAAKISKKTRPKH